MSNLPVKRDEKPPEIHVLLEKALELERIRAEASTKDLEVASEALKVADADNERQYRYHSNRFEKQHSHERERWRSKNQKQWVLIGASIALLFGFLGFFFFGNSEQQEGALQVIEYLFTFGAGLGIGYLLRSRGRKDA